MSTGAEVARLFARDASLWTNSGEDEWLGWIDAVGDAVRGLSALESWAGPLGPATSASCSAAWAARASPRS